MKRILQIFFCAICFAVFATTCCKDFAVSAPKETNFQEFFHGLFGDDFSKKAFKTDKVFVSGSPMGFTLLGDGVVVVGIGDVESSVGKVSPCEGHDIREGDILLSIDGVRIEGFKSIETILNEQQSIDKSFEIVVLRDKKRIVLHIVPAVDIETGKKRLGLWIRDNTAGVGTLTYVTQNNRFGALGHPVCDADTGTFLPVKSGDLFLCNVVGIEKGNRGKAGELRGVFLKTGSPLGNVTKNNEFGIYGEFEESQMDQIFLREVEVAKREEIKPGKATILATVSGIGPQEYEIEIVKATNQTTSKSKSMVIRIVDQRLLDATGGIVQGMSGSPILQDGKFVGAVTHVFVSDPTKGFGIYAEWMLEQ